MVIYRLALHFRRPAVPIPLSTSATRRLSSSSRRPRSVSISSVRSEAEIKTSGPMAIAEAENEVIFRVVEEESPDLTPEDMIILSGGEKVKGGSKGVRVNGNGYSSLRDEVEDIEDNDHVVLPLSFGMILRALSRNKKDVINVFGSAATLGLLVWRLVESRKIIGGNWFILTVAAWVSLLHPLDPLHMDADVLSAGMDIRSHRRQIITFIFIKTRANPISDVPTTTIRTLRNPRISRHTLLSTLSLHFLLRLAILHSRLLRPPLDVRHDAARSCHFRPRRYTLHHRDPRSPKLPLLVDVVQGSNSSRRCDERRRRTDHATSTADERLSPLPRHLLFRRSVHVQNRLWIGEIRFGDCAGSSTGRQDRSNRPQLPT